MSERPHRIVDGDKLGLTEENPTIKPYEQDPWSRLPDSRMPIETSLGILDGVQSPARIIHGWESTFWYGATRILGGMPTVYPGDRLYLMCQGTKIRMGRIIVCRFQGVVRDRVVVEGMLKGVPIPTAEASKPAVQS